MQNNPNKCRTLWVRLYIYAVLCLIVSLVLYVWLLPNMISSNSTILVLLGVLLALICWMGSESGAVPSGNQNRRCSAYFCRPCGI
ncbi:hypothetical protein EXX62_19860 [Escherichia coli]|nr:hypothetical protein EXX62_19860 [Escherichia coli]